MFELLFCPQHGVFRPDNWPLIAATWQGLLFQAQLVYLWIRHAIVGFKRKDGHYDV